MIRRWPHQERGVREVWQAFDAGDRRVCLTSPTGMGKSLMVSDCLVEAQRRGWHSIVYTNRQSLLHQLATKTLAPSGIEFGFRADGYDQNLEARCQLSSVQTERSRTIDSFQWRLHGVGKKCLVIFDEAHLHNNDTGRNLSSRHLECGHLILGVTATPIDLGDCYDKLIVAGTLAEGRECGALVRARIYGCPEPDTRRAGPKGPQQTLDDVSTPQAERLFAKNHTIRGQVFTEFDRLNPTRRPTVLFASGVRESLWFAEEFTARGIAAAHVDGEDIWHGGQWYKSDPTTRQELLGLVTARVVKVVCNRYVMREGIDVPILGHCIFATVFGSLSTYLQTCGRVLRYHPDKAGGVTIQDHGGHWWRFGSPNADRPWSLDFTHGAVKGMREDRFRDRAEKEPYRCTRCGLIILSQKCNTCGQEVVYETRSRPVVMEDGTIAELRGDIFSPRKRQCRPGTVELWKRVYFRCRKAKNPLTFRQAEALFVRENFYYPPRNLPLMPKREMDWYRHVVNVPYESLRK